MYNGNNLGDFVVFVSSELRVDFFITVVASVQIDKTLQGSISIIFELIVSIFTLPHISHFFDHESHDIGD